MYTSTLYLNGVKLLGKLNMEVIKTTRDILQKEFDRVITIQDVFKEVSDKNYVYISVIITQIATINNDISIEEFTTLYKNEDNLIDNSLKIFNFLNELMDLCIPKNNSGEEDEFEDIPIFNVQDDWDFGYMEYLWKTTLNRSEGFWEITPKNFFEQIDIYKKVNGVKEENVELV